MLQCHNRIIFSDMRKKMDSIVSQLTSYQNYSVICYPWLWSLYQCIVGSHIQWLVMTLCLNFVVYLNWHIHAMCRSTARGNTILQIHAGFDAVKFLCWFIGISYWCCNWQIFYCKPNLCDDSSDINGKHFIILMIIQVSLYRCLVDF